MARPSASALVTPASQTHIVAAAGVFRDATGDARQYYQGDVVTRAVAAQFGLGVSQEVTCWTVAGTIAAPGSASAVEVTTNVSQPSTGDVLLRPRADLANASTIRLVGTVDEAGTTGAELRLEYSSDGTTFQQFQASNAPKIAIATTGAKDSGAITVPAGAKTNVWLRLMSAGGAGDSASLSGIVVSYQPA